MGWGGNFPLLFQSVTTAARMLKLQEEIGVYAGVRPCFVRVVDGSLVRAMHASILRTSSWVAPTRFYFCRLFQDPPMFLEALSCVSTSKSPVLYWCLFHLLSCFQPSGKEPFDPDQASLFFSDVGVPPPFLFQDSASPYAHLIMEDHAKLLGLATCYLQNYG